MFFFSRFQAIWTKRLNWHRHAWNYFFRGSECFQLTSREDIICILPANGVKLKSFNANRQEGRQFLEPVVTQSPRTSQTPTVTGSATSMTAMCSRHDNIRDSSSVSLAVPTPREPWNGFAARLMMCHALVSGNAEGSFAPKTVLKAAYNKNTIIKVEEAWSKMKVKMGQHSDVGWGGVGGTKQQQQKTKSVVKISNLIRSY